MSTADAHESFARDCFLYLRRGTNVYELAANPMNEPDTGHEQGGDPSDEELQRRLEEQIRKVRIQDLLLESVASILNLSARRIGKEDERDLEQARIGIEAVRAVLDLIEPGPREQVREALSQVQMLYAREARGGAQESDAPSDAPGAPDDAGGEQAGGSGQRPSGLWVPPGN